ncbi:hypothetical protein SmJEL517_g03866 [Synchytrium microbalum]|uniref:gamma-glutamylcyclotransferase n=1 Tax=Synchytrium microbalum TaxID=1806994 RepID=A0A507BUY1_9FUNG|nr:uncharacterized protein SmJEL517_g03866 [Synchytrium microbalum]TPX33240.1 hypothetical protein SmJEL517_g03866 [Synchytrium microbalum]
MDEPFAVMDDEPIWCYIVQYLGYGSNMSPKVLTGRRGIKPTESVAVFAEAYVLVFDMRGAPYVEPGFATVLPHDHPHLAKKLEYYPTCHGVAFKITKQEFKKIQQTEGGGGRKGSGYEAVCIKCVSYDGQKIEAWTLQSYPKNLYTRAADVEHSIAPSARYLALCTDGAALHQVNPDYLNWMKSYPVLLKIGIPESAHVYLQSLSSVIWTVYDGFARHVFGSGVGYKGMKVPKPSATSAKTRA